MKNFYNFLLFFLIINNLYGQSITVSESCSNGTLNDFVLNQIGIDTSGRYFYSDGVRDLKYDNNEWKYSISNVLSYTNIARTKPLPPCSINYPYIGCTNDFKLVSNCVLPIEFISISFKNVDNNLNVLFETGTESNIEIFKIQKKSNFEFIDILDVKPNNTPSKYDLTINGIFNNIEYFRILTIEKDSKKSISKIFTVQFDLNDIELLKTNSNVSFYSDEIIESIIVFNSLGQSFKVNNNFILKNGFHQIIVLTKNKQKVFKIFN